MKVRTSSLSMLLVVLLCRSVDLRRLVLLGSDLPTFEPSPMPAALKACGAAGTQSTIITKVISPIPHITLITTSTSQSPS